MTTLDRILERLARASCRSSADVYEDAFRPLLAAVEQMANDSLPERRAGEVCAEWRKLAEGP